MCQLNIIITKKFTTKEEARNAYTIVKERVSDFEDVKISGQITNTAEEPEPD